MFLPDVLAGRAVAVAGPAGPLAEAVADAAGRAGAAVALCGQDTESLDELAWDLAERRDSPVDIVAWDGADPGAALRDALAAAGRGDAALVLLGGAGWGAVAAAAWQGAGPVVVIAPDDEVPLEPGSATVLVAPASAAVDRLAAWAVFLLSPAGAVAGGQIIRINDTSGAIY